MIQWTTQALKGSAQRHTAASRVARPSSAKELPEVIHAAQSAKQTVGFRGGGWSYGDAATNSGAVVGCMDAISGIVDWDPAAGLMTVNAGTTIGEILRHAMADGWTLPAAPGILGVTAAGAVANDVHGKDTPGNGNIGDATISLTLVGSDGVARDVSWESDPPLMGATVAGLGLTGAITRVTFQLQWMPSTDWLTKSIPTHSLAETLAVVISAHDAGFTHVVAWVDPFGDFGRAGRGCVEAGRWDPNGTRDLTRPDLLAGLRESTHLFGVIPPRLAWPVVGLAHRRSTVNAFSALRHYRLRRRGPVTAERPFGEWNFIHNQAPEGHRIYGRQGMLEIQPLIPDSAGPDAIRDLLAICRGMRAESLLCGLKRHRPGLGLLSFGQQGWSLGIDVAGKEHSDRELQLIAETVFDFTISCGGHVYLAKDQLLDARRFNLMYPRAEEMRGFLAARGATGVFSSDMARRLELVPA